MHFRSSDIFLTLLALAVATQALLAVHALREQRNSAGLLAEQRKMVRSLGLTDLVLFTDARYTRHPAMADRHAPFQDFPLAMEHFPSGSLLGPPPAGIHERH